MFDVREFHFNIPEVISHLHPLDDRKPETLVGQKRILKKWQNQRSSLINNTKLDPEEISKLQLSRISFLVDSVFATHPFYHNLYKQAGYRSGDIVNWSDYHALPAISKADILDNFDQFIINRCLPLEECYTSRTSGSSGRTLTIIQDEATTDQGILFYFRHYEQLISRQRNPEEWLYEIYLAPPRYTSFDGSYPIFTISQECPPEVVSKHLKKISPVLLWAFPSFLLRMLESEEDFTELPLQAICTHSESSTKGERQKISERFGVPVLDEYSSEELFLIATECRNNKYHIVEDNVRVDVLSPDETGMGEIVATSLVNTYMPFIKYRQGDIIKISENVKNCTCGNHFRAIEEFYGRSDQFMKNKFGKLISPDLVMGLYDRTLITSKANISEFQIVQVGLDLVELYLIPESGDVDLNNNMILDFCTGMRELFSDPDLHIKVLPVSQMPNSLSHKRRVITSNFSLKN